MRRLGRMVEAHGGSRKEVVAKRQPLPICGGLGIRHIVVFGRSQVFELTRIFASFTKLNAALQVLDLEKTILLKKNLSDNDKPHTIRQLVRTLDLQAKLSGTGQSTGEEPHANFITECLDATDPTQMARKAIAEGWTAAQVREAARRKAA